MARAVSFLMTYKTVNRALIAAMVILAALISIAYFRNDVNCLMRLKEGRECIICGCTRDFFDMFHFAAPTRNPLSGYLFFAIAFELVYRVVYAFKTAPRALIIADIVSHGIAAAIFMTFNFLNIYC